MNYESIYRSGTIEPFTIEENLCRNVVVLRIFPSIPIESVNLIISIDAKVLIIYWVLMTMTPNFSYHILHLESVSSAEKSVNLKSQNFYSRVSKEEG